MSPVTPIIPPKADHHLPRLSWGAAISFILENAVVPTTMKLTTLRMFA